MTEKTYNIGYQMAYAAWITSRFGPATWPRPTFFGAWAEMQGQLGNPHPWLLS